MPLPAAEAGLLVPGDGIGEGPEGGVGGAEERPFAKCRQMTRNIIWDGELGRELDLVAAVERHQPFIEGPVAKAAQRQAG